MESGMLDRSAPVSFKIVILAAGGSRRLGRPKQLVQHGHESLLRRAVGLATAALQDASAVVVVTGAYRDAVAASLTDLAVAPRLVDNPHWERGIGSSLRVGVQAALALAPRDEPPAVLLMLCDQPLLTTAHLVRLIAAVRVGARLAASSYGGTVGVPAAFAPALLGELLALEPDQGAKVLLQRHAALVHAVSCPEGALDVDTPEDVERLHTLAPPSEQPSEQPLDERRG
jgi:molybdenum cofactor cytidylyltransferase